MALPRKGTRSISVDGIVYRWHMRKQTLYQSLYKQCVTFAIEQSDRRECMTLTVEIPASHIEEVEGSDGSGIVTPGVVAAAVRQARQKGWRPDQAGGSFFMLMTRDSHETS